VCEITWPPAVVVMHHTKMGNEALCVPVKGWRYATLGAINVAT